MLEESSLALVRSGREEPKVTTLVRGRVKMKKYVPHIGNKVNTVRLSAGLRLLVSSNIGLNVLELKDELVVSFIYKVCNTGTLCKPLSKDTLL